MLSPKRTKFRKYHRGKMRGKVSFCNFEINNFYLFLFNLTMFIIKI